MSDSKIQQVIQPPNARITSDTISNNSKLAWSTLAAVLKAQFGMGLDPDAPPSHVFLSDAFCPIADGAGPTIKLRRGLAIVIDPLVGGEFDGDVRPIFTDIDQIVSFGTNNDGSGNPRVDLLAVRPIIQDTDLEQVLKKDTLDGATYYENLHTRRILSFEFKIYEGVASASPVTPVVTDNWITVCSILRPNGQSAVLQSDVNDLRLREVTRVKTLVNEETIDVKNSSNEYIELRSLVGVRGIARFLWDGTNWSNVKNIKFPGTMNNLAVGSYRVSLNEVAGGTNYFALLIQHRINWTGIDRSFSIVNDVSTSFFDIVCYDGSGSEADPPTGASINIMLMGGL